MSCLKKEKRNTQLQDVSELWLLGYSVNEREKKNVLSFASICRTNEDHNHLMALCIRCMHTHKSHSTPIYIKRMYDKRLCLLTKDYTEIPTLKEVLLHLWAESVSNYDKVFSQTRCLGLF